jgi:hypothetical protein
VKYNQKTEKISKLYQELNDTGVKSVKDICHRVGIGRSTFYKWKTKIAELKPEDIVFEQVESTKINPMRKDAPEPIDTFDNFLKIPVITEYERECKINRKKPYTSHLFRIFNASLTHPDKIKSLSDAKYIFSEFDSLFRENKQDITNERYRKVFRAFLNQQGINIPKMDPVLNSGTDSKGDYAPVYMNPIEVEKVAEIVGDVAGEKYEDIFRFHHEIFARPHTLHSMIPNVEIKYLDVNGKTLPFGKCDVYEAKQKKYYTKLILNPNALESISKYNGKQIISDSYRTFDTTYSKALKKAYYIIGKIHDGIKYPKGQEGWLWYNRPVYSIRHSAAVNWLHRTSFDVNLVATMGWEKPETLTKFYARISTTNIMEKGQCYYCNPPSIRSNMPVFCSAPHSLAWSYSNSLYQ